MKNKARLHPLLLSLYPVIFLLSNNLGKVPFLHAIVPLLVNFLITAVVFMIYKRISNDEHKAGVGASFFIIFYSLYGHIFELILKNQYFKSDYRPFFILYLVVVIVGSWAILRLLRNPQSYTYALNLVSIILVSVPLFQIGWFSLKSISSNQFVTDSEITIETNLEEMPNIYYIILDAYGQQDMLDSVYSIDNQEFIHFLKDQGFFVAEKSNANYLRTTLSLFSSLNMEYLENTEDMPGADTRTINDLEQAISNSLVRKILEDLGYQIYVIPNGIETTDWENTKNATSPWLKLVDTNFFFSYINSTLMVIVTQNFLYDLQRSRINNSFIGLETIPQEPGPNFVFAHIIAPHPPFVFDAQGQAIEAVIPYRLTDAIELAVPSEEYISKYYDQLQYINSRMEETITTILENSEKPPVIIIQGDHGPGAYFDWDDLENNTCLAERTSILNAFYLPGIENELYSSISPVNTFRIIFKQVFGLSYAILPDKVYFAPDSNIYEVTEITDSISCFVDLE